MPISPARPRRRTAGVLATLSVIASFATGSAEAATTTKAVCSSQLTVTISPGFSITPGAGTLSSNGKPGIITCIGTIGGHRVTGPGTVGLDERYTHGDCLSHVGTGTATITVPTTAGLKHIAGAATSRRTALALSADVRFPGAHFSGVGLALPLRGSCLLVPMRQALISVTGTLDAI